MDFQDWVDQQEGKNQGERIARAARILGEEARTVSSWYYLQGAPRISSAAMIVLKTGGAVDYNGIYRPHATKKVKGRD
ncbi:hypothetical protein [Pontibacterium sp.]|uniref:hypothetical protein n=1 Tax=Pontibacterium sp. TaxID=2036026 RepID=UPI00356613EB